MRCDRLTLVIFRAIGSIFASRSAPRRARFHPRPPAGTSAAKSRSARPCCLLCASNRGISKHPRTASRNALDRPLTVYAFRSLTDPRQLPISALIRSTTPQIHPLETHPPTRHKSAPAAPPQTKNPTLSRPSPTRSTPDSPIVLSFFTQPPNT